METDALFAFQLFLSQPGFSSVKGCCHSKGTTSSWKDLTTEKTWTRQQRQQHRQRPRRRKGREERHDGDDEKNRPAKSRRAALHRTAPHCTVLCRELLRFVLAALCLVCTIASCSCSCPPRLWSCPFECEHVCACACACKREDVCSVRLGWMNTTRHDTGDSKISSTDCQRSPHHHHHRHHHQRQRQRQRQQLHKQQLNLTSPSSVPTTTTCTHTHINKIASSRALHRMLRLVHLSSRPLILVLLLLCTVSANAETSARAAASVPTQPTQPAVLKQQTAVPLPSPTNLAPSSASKPRCVLSRRVMHQRSPSKSSDDLPDQPSSRTSLPLYRYVGTQLHVKMTIILFVMIMMMMIE